MKLREAIDMADRLRANKFSDDDKVRWINELEGLIQTEIHGILPENVKAPYKVPGDDEVVLLLPFPYDRLYWMYLLASYDYANGEYASYANSEAACKREQKRYHAWYMRHHRHCGCQEVL